MSRLGPLARMAGGTERAGTKARFLTWVKGDTVIPFTHSFPT